MSWQVFRDRNVPLLRRIIDVYGSCAMLAWDGERVVGFLRFYPKALSTMAEAGQMCLQQAFPAGPTERLVEQQWPSQEELADKSLSVHCLMTGSPSQEENPYQRKGLGTSLVHELVHWARDNGWERIETVAYEDLPVLYEITGSAGLTFWEKLGFEVVEKGVEPELQQESDLVHLLRRQAAELGLLPDDVANRYTMCLELA